MEKRKLGKSDLEVSAIGYGAWGIGGLPFWTNEGDEISLRSIKRAIDFGINFFDTAPVYGFGHSETIIGTALKSVRDSVVLATKCGLRWDREEVSSIRRDCSRKSIREEIDQSLRRLQTDRIDLYQVHWPDFNTEQKETMEALLELQMEEKIRHIGVSNYSLEQLSESLKYASVVSIQSEYSLLERDLEKEIIPFCIDHQIGVLAYSPLGSGILTGKYDQNSRFKDWRKRGGNFSGKKLKEKISKVERLKQLSRKIGKSCSQVAINWVSNKAGISLALVGVKNAAQVNENLAALGWSMSSEEGREVERIFSTST